SDLRKGSVGALGGGAGERNPLRFWPCVGVVCPEEDVSPVPLERGIQARNASLIFCCSSHLAAIVTTASPKQPWTETGASRSGAFSLSDSLASDSHIDLWVATAAPITLPSACDVHRVSLSDRSVARRSRATNGHSAPSDKASEVRSFAR